jgi:hypothetical protein
LDPLVGIEALSASLQKSSFSRLQNEKLFGTLTYLLPLGPVTFKLASSPKSRNSHHSEDCSTLRPRHFWLAASLLAYKRGLNFEKSSPQRSSGKK